MASPRVLVLRTAGTNCDQETKYAFERAGATVDLIHIHRLVETRVALHAYHSLVLPGGFTYGDDVAAGKILANELKHRLGEELVRFVEEGKLILGICNGFQALVKMGLLPGNALFPAGKDTKRRKKAARTVPAEPPPSESEDDDFEDAAPAPVTPLPPIRTDFTLTFNDSGKFESRWIHLKICATTSEFIKEGDRIYLPVAHGEGKFVARDEASLQALRDSGQIVLRYVDPDGKPAGYPHNPNGSVDAIAGITDPTGRIFGIMPHPERHIHPTQHPRWTREGLKERPDGLAIFENAVRYMKKNLL